MTARKTTDDLYLSALRCPICGEAMRQEKNDGAGRLYCSGSRPHSFDMARSGYVHLAPRHSGGGDGKEAVRARRGFLAQGYYEIAVRALGDLLETHVPSGLVVDAGCGEGYYTNALADRFGGRYAVCGFDLSRDAVDAAAKAAKQRDNGARYAVASVFELPLADGVADAVVNIFAPCAEAEYCRVLRPGGVLIVLGAGERHLLGLKRALYSDTYPNTERADLPRSMVLCEQKTLYGTVCVQGNESIGQLFSMTPYYWRTSPEDSKKLQALEVLETEIEFDCRVYRKQ